MDEECQNCREVTDALKVANALITFILEYYGAGEINLGDDYKLVKK